jgi:hypothetical protein
LHQFGKVKNELQSLKNKRVFDGQVVDCHPNGNPKAIKTYSKGVEI